MQSQFCKVNQTPEGYFVVITDQLSLAWLIENRGDLFDRTGQYSDNKIGKQLADEACQEINDALNSWLSQRHS